MKKLYYSIGEVSNITGVEPHVLRYWETKFEKLKPTKNGAGKRMYTDRDIETILQLKVLIREEKYSTAGARKALRHLKKEDSVIDGAAQEIPLPLVRDLKEIKLFLQDLIKKL